jgi:hypothetical protein
MPHIADFARFAALHPRLPGCLIVFPIIAGFCFCVVTAIFFIAIVPVGYAYYMTDVFERILVFLTCTVFEIFAKPLRQAAPPITIAEIYQGIGYLLLAIWMFSFQYAEAPLPISTAARPKRSPPRKSAQCRAPIPKSFANCG